MFIGVSLSEPHTSKLNGGFFIHILLGECDALWGERELYGVVVLHRQLNILFKALPPKVLIIVNVYTGNETITVDFNCL